MVHERSWLWSVGRSARCQLEADNAARVQIDDLFDDAGRCRVTMVTKVTPAPWPRSEPSTIVRIARPLRRLASMARTLILYCKSGGRGCATVVVVGGSRPSLAD